MTPAQNIMTALGGGHIMTPGGGDTGAPLRAPRFPAMQAPPMQARFANIPALLQALQGWRADVGGPMPRPTFGNILNGPQMTPGGGGTGAPIQGSPAPPMPMDTMPQAGSSGAIPAPNSYKLPTY